MCCQSAASKAIPEQADASTAVYGINGRAISRFGDRFFLSARRCQPGSLRDFRLLERFGGSFAKCRTGIEVGNLGDVPSVCVAVEDVDYGGPSWFFNGIVSSHRQHCRPLKGPGFQFL
jgi:hypothetical protein